MNGHQMTKSHRSRGRGWRRGINDSTDTYHTPKPSIPIDNATNWKRGRGRGNDFRRFDDRSQRNGRWDLQRDSCGWPRERRPMRRRGGAFRGRNRINEHYNRRPMRVDAEAPANHEYPKPYRQHKRWRARVQKDERERTPSTKDIKANARFNEYEDRDDIKADEEMEPRCARNTCGECGDEGHWARDCSFRKTEMMRKHGDTCNKCGEAGHWARDCKSKGGVSKMEYLRAVHGNKCNRCGQQGHWARDCNESYNGPGYDDY